MVPIYNFGVNYRGSIILGILSLGKWLADHGFTQVSLRVTLADTFRHRRLKLATDHMRVLSHLKENHGGTTILAQRQVFGFGNTGVFHQLMQYLFAQRGLLVLLRLLQRRQDIFVKLKIGALAEPGNRLGNVSGLYFPQLRGY